MEENVNFKKVFLITMIVSLSIAALVGIAIILIGRFGEIEARIFFTTLAIGGFSLTGLCSSVLYDKNRYMILAGLGMLVAVLGFLFTTVIIWGDLLDSNLGLWKTTIIFIILSVGIAHSSLLLLIKSEKTAVNTFLSLTLLFIFIVAAMLIYMILVEFDVNDIIFFKVLAVFAILDALGTIVTPILYKVVSLHKPVMQI